MVGEKEAGTRPQEPPVLARYTWKNMTMGITVLNPTFLHGKFADCRKKIPSMWNTASGFASKQEHQTTREEGLTSFPWWRGGALERWFLTTRCPSRGGSAGMRIKFKSSNYFLNFSPASNVSNCQRCFWGVSLVLPFFSPPLLFHLILPIPLHWF